MNTNYNESRLQHQSELFFRGKLKKKSGQQKRIALNILTI